jgi:hypothetical protein
VSACRCHLCSACEGTGTVFVDWRGRFVAVHASDDLDERETCQQCRGSGVEVLCDACADWEERYGS